MKSILITGGAGFIGSNLTKKLLSNTEYNVIVMDNFDDFYPRSDKERNIELFFQCKNFQFFEGDIRIREDLAKIPEIDYIVHLAAKTGVRQSIFNPEIYEDINVGGMQSILDFAKDKKVDKFIFSSSSSVYGLNSNLPWVEDEELFPASPYAITKIGGEELGRLYAELYGFQFIALRLFTVYGPGQRPDLAIQNFFTSVIKDQPLLFFGDGQTTRDYTYIDDVVSGIEGALNYTGASFEIFNIGSQAPVCLSTLVAEIETICEKAAVINRQPEQLGDLPSTFADITKAGRLLGYYPQVNLRDGLSRYYNWLF